MKPGTPEVRRRVCPSSPQKLKAYQTTPSATRDVLLLSTKHPLFEWLLTPPPREPAKGL